MNTQLLVGDLPLIELPPLIHSLTDSPVGKRSIKLLKDPTGHVLVIPVHCTSHETLPAVWAGKRNPAVNRATIARIRD